MVGIMPNKKLKKIWDYLKEIQGMAHPSIIHEFHPSKKLFTKQLTAHFYSMQNLSGKAICLLENELEGVEDDS